jgi:hypothetical protein
MKRFIIVLTTVLISFSAIAQAKQEVIASAGGYNSTANISISWTLGETIIPTWSSPGLILTHGFQQQIIITSVEENLDNQVKITVFPNPASDNVNIIFEEPVDGEVKIFMLNSLGKLVKTDFIEPAMVEKQINLQDLPAGVYYFKLVKGNLSNVYKVVKL